VKDNLIHSWTRSKDRWWRRAALVSTVPLNSKARGGTGDTRRTLEICQLLVDDRDDMVIKALSWALRELAKRDPTAVREFLKANQHALAARVIREVKNKLSTGLKNPRLRKESNTQ
jgi:3-methyladenine DNA glycosylase AlkD